MHILYFVALKIIIDRTTYWWSFVHIANKQTKKKKTSPLTVWIKSFFFFFLFSVCALIFNEIECIKRNIFSMYYEHMNASTVVCWRHYHWNVFFLSAYHARCCLVAAICTLHHNSEKLNFAGYFFLSYGDDGAYVCIVSVCVRLWAVSSRHACWTFVVHGNRSSSRSTLWSCLVIRIAFNLTIS